MQILVTHLTRMDRGFICVAGLTREYKHVRPVLGGGRRIPTAMLAAEGGAFELGAVVDIGTAEPVPHAPEIEDQRFSPDSTRFVRYANEEQLWKALNRTAQAGLRAIF